MPNFINLKRFAKTRKVTLQRNEEKILKKSKQKTLISSLVWWNILNKARQVIKQKIKEKIEKDWAKTFIPNFINLKRFAKTRKVFLIKLSFFIKYRIVSTIQKIIDRNIKVICQKN